jgi:hypothetical protein
MADTILGAKDNFDLQSFYLNIRRLGELAGEEAVGRALNVVPFYNPQDKMAANARFASCARVLKNWLLANSEKIQPFAKLLVTGKLKRGDLFMTQRDFYCRNLSQRVRPSKDEPRMTAKYELADRNVSLVMRMHRDHLALGSPGDLLSGHVSDLLVVGVVNDINDNAVTASPIFVGTMVDATAKMFAGSSGYIEVMPERIDNFSKCAGESFPRHRELDALAKIPENDIKHAMAELIEDDAVPKDWGGEKSDMFSTKLRINGERLSTAFIFKGPSKFHPMKLADLGKNGDQIDRLYTEPAQLLVLQHCHEVTSSVRNTMRAFANQIGNPRAYCIIDGKDTLRILRAYGKCGQKSKPMKPMPPPFGKGEPDDI